MNARALFLSLALGFLLTACSLSGSLLQPSPTPSGPPNDFLLSDPAWELVENLQVLRKVRCDTISPEARALGIEDAWLVAFEYDSPYANVGHVSNYVLLYVKASGEWRNAWLYYGLEERCP